MRLTISPLLLLALTAIADAQLLFPFGARPSTKDTPPASDKNSIHRPLPFGQLPIMPPTTEKDGDMTIQPSVPLNDILGTLRSLTTFSSLTRMQTTTTTLLSDLSTNTTVLAPLNSAIESLPRKPWESPRDYDEHGVSAYEGDDGQDRANANLRRFVEAHLVTKNPWDKGEKVKTIGGRDVWWEEKDGKKVVMPDEIEVDRVANQVANGEVWILKGVLNYV
ncbi:hypothetical protein NLU13_1180 [Sarocladium strictum]|uniref:FAS1 domain-containing protein n=1 Tax=Sarocladium strictum TaxID=5046 RepID=A0AA39LBJ0_SARSR|nr:hypothetical protein NLU13_1180 [Sarocladium strictum]